MHNKERKSCSKKLHKDKKDKGKISRHTSPIIHSKSKTKFSNKMHL